MNRSVRPRLSGKNVKRVSADRYAQSTFSIDGEPRPLSSSTAAAGTRTTASRESFLGRAKMPRAAEHALRRQLRCTTCHVIIRRASGT